MLEQNSDSPDGSLFNYVTLRDRKRIGFHSINPYVDISVVDDEGCWKSFERLRKEPDVPPEVRKTITVLTSNLDLNDQLNLTQRNIELELPLISGCDGEGYDLRALVCKAVEAYHLETASGLQVDYWSNSL